MKRWGIIITAAAALTAVAAASFLIHRPRGNNITNTTTMLLTSPSFNNSELIPRKFTCDGGNINPEFDIQNVPEGAKSLALIMHDPDAPRAGGFTHWVVWNVAPMTNVIKQESVPPGGIEGRNSGGQNAYMGPCPPSGTHHYEFRLYALDARLDIPMASGRAELEAAMQGHVLEQVLLVGLYARQL